MDDFNKQDTNIIPDKEFSGGISGTSFVGNPEATEFNPPADNVAAARRKKAGKLTGIVTSLLAVSMLGISVALPNVAKSDATATIEKVAATDTSVVCYVVADGDEGLSVVISNYFTHREFDVKTGENTFTAEGLKPDMEYTVEVRSKAFLGGSTVIASKKVRTEKTN